MTVSTAYSASMLANLEGQLYSRHRLRMEPFILETKVADSTQRFRNLIKHAYGTAAFKHLDKHATTLNDLFSRSVYLFDVLRVYS